MTHMPASESRSEGARSRSRREPCVANNAVRCSSHTWTWDVIGDYYRGYSGGY